MPSTEPVFTLPTAHEGEWARASERGVRVMLGDPRSDAFHSGRRRLTIEAGGSEAPGWTTKAPPQVALIFAPFDAQELVAERLKV